MKNGAMALLVTLLGLVPLTGAQASSSLIDYVGFSYEEGTFPPSQLGDRLDFVAIIDNLTAPLSWDPMANEYTLSISELISQGEENPDPNNIVVRYNGGAFDLYEDPQMNAQPGEYPPNASAPGSYRDGVHYLGGQMTQFIVYYNTQFNSGAFEADMMFVNGSHLDELGLATTGYTFGGVFVFGTPQGYDLQWDGQVLLDVIPVEATTWGAIKLALRR